MRLLPPPGPTRLLAIATGVNTAGRGVWLTASALFLTRAAGLTATQVGVGLSVAALVNLVASAPMGYLADRYGPRGIQVGALLTSGLFSVALITVRSLPMFILIATGSALADAAYKGARGAVIAGAVPATERVYTRAYLRAVTNVGISFGAVAAGFGIAADTRQAYVALILVDAASFVAAALVLTRLTPIPPVPAPTHGPRLVALRDRPFLAFTLLDGLMSMHFGLINIALPLWIAGHTSAPRWLVSALMLINTVMVVLFQVRASRGTEDVPGAARASRRAGVAIAVACALFAASGAVPTGAAVLLLLCGALVHVLGELWQSAAGWGISFGLAPEHAHGQYQGAYAMGNQLGGMLAPMVVTTLAIGLGEPGWLLLGVLFALLGTLVPPVSGWALRTRAAGSGREAAPVAGVGDAGRAA